MSSELPYFQNKPLLGGRWTTSCPSPNRNPVLQVTSGGWGGEVLNRKNLATNYFPFVSRGCCCTLQNRAAVKGLRVEWFAFGARLSGCFSSFMHRICSDNTL